MTATDEPTVFIVDDDVAVCDALGLLVESVGLKAERHTSARAFLDEYDPARPGCLVLDVRMPGMSGLEVQDELNRRGHQMPVIILTGHGDMRMAVRAMQAGAVDCLAKPFNDQELLDRIHHAIALDRTTRRERAINDEIAGRIGLLSDREHEVMSRVVRGMTNQKIAEELGITKKTVDAHRAKVMEKTQAKSLADLVQIELRARGAAGSRHIAPDSGTT